MVVILRSLDKQLENLIAKHYSEAQYYVYTIKLAQENLHFRTFYTVYRV